MFTTSASDDSDAETTSSLASVRSSPFHYAITHVFLPVELPQENDHTLENDHSLVRAVCAAAHAYSARVQGTLQWHHVTKMLDNLQVSAPYEHLDKGRIISQLCGMQIGDILVFFVRPRNTATVVTKQENCVLLEPFEVSPSSDDVEKTAESLICSYPYSVIEIPNEALDDERYQSELANFLSHPLLSAVRGHITALDTGILRGVGRTVDVPRVTKRVRDDVRPKRHWDSSTWRRSSLWLLIRVAIQISVDRSLGRACYKAFVLFFICTLARDPNNIDLSSDLLHLMSCKILRRLSKLGASAPDWLSASALDTCTRLQEILDARWKPLSVQSSLFRNPPQDELKRDTQLSLLGSHEYIRNALASHSRISPCAPFNPSHRRRGTIEDFLSSNGSFFEKAYDADPDVTLIDVEQSVEQGIDDWIACVTNVAEACTQLEILMDKYMENAHDRYIIRSDNRSSENYSIMFLTGIELFVALDKLVVREIPMLADYSPHLPITSLEQLLLRKATSLHRLARAYQYILARQSRSRPGWSVLANEFTKDSFPVRYYEQSLHLQRLKARIEEDAIAAAACDVTQPPPSASVMHAYDEYHECCVARRWPAEDTRVSRSPLPDFPLHTKVVVFELHCPVCVRIWRCAAPRIWNYLRGGQTVIRDSENEDEDNLLEYAPKFQRYFVHRRGPPLCVQIHFAYFYPGPVLRYVLQGARVKVLRVWQPRLYEAQPSCFEYNFSEEEHRFENNTLYYLVNSTSYTSNDILKIEAQAQRPADLSFDECIAFRHLRSGCSLQWLNILRELRARSLNLRRRDVHFLFLIATSHVGPLDSNTGTLVWHQELQDSCFCNALLGELDSLIMEAGASSIDGMTMSTISLLLTRVLSSSPGERVSEQAIKLLRSIRRKTFTWVQELSYNLVMAPMDEERSSLLWNMAAACRSAFDVDPATVRNVLRSVEDIGALVSCALFVHALRPELVRNHYARLLFNRDRRLSLALEEVLWDVILADASDNGIDLAICTIFASHKPGACRWERLQRPNARWLTCETRVTRDQPSRTVHVNLLNGELRVDGQPLGGLPRVIRDSSECQHIFRDQGFFLMPSNLPGMDFTTLGTMSERKVHFSLRDHSLVIQVQSDQTTEILELIPSSVLWEDLPTSLVDGHIHWLNLSTELIEIRPIKRLWEQSLENWRIDCRLGQYRVYKGHETLVDIRSPTCAMVAGCFECLEDAENILVTHSVDARQTLPALQLSVALPRYGLSFFVNEREQLQSRDFKDMIYDQNQSIGALLGLNNLLVLRQGTHIPEELIPRRVLIPSGFPEKRGDHQVRVDTVHDQFIPSNEPLSYHSYVVDTELGCLIGDGSLESMRSLAYLHAATSFHRPDPLTGKTGVQAALSLLQSAGCRSVMQLKALGSGRNWISTQYPQINIAYKDIRHRYYWGRDADDYTANEEESLDAQRAAELQSLRAARRALYLFPWQTPESTFPEDNCNYDGGDRLAMCSPAEPGIPTLAHLISPPRHISNHDTRWQITLGRLFSSRSTPKLPTNSTLSRHSSKALPDDIPELNQLLSLLVNKPDPSFQREYVTRLNASAQRVREESRTTFQCGVAGTSRIGAVEKHFARCRVNYLAALDTLKRSLGPTTDPHEQALERFSQWPPITADVLLRCLASTSPINVPIHWKKCLVSLALLLLELQRSRRLLRFALDGLEEEFSKELENEGCDGWHPEDYPEWLLIQIQGNFLIRRAQAETAMDMISPQSGKNTVLQVNMGEGKSSVIIPIVAATLADGNQLVRVAVPKALTVQMFELLVARLGGLANRPIYHLPFSRTSEYDKVGRVTSLQVDDLHRLMSQCMIERGILLAQPEHIVSLKLTSIKEQVCNGKVANSLPESQNPICKHITTALPLSSLQKSSLVRNIFRPLAQLANYSRAKGVAWARHGELSVDSHGASDGASKWLSLQKWMHSHVRDILDESDEILHARFQLIYTVGLQRHMDGYPDRWTISQQVLRLAKECASTLSRDDANSIEYECDPPGSFPHIRLVRGPDAGRRHLISLIVEDVLAGRLPSFRFPHISEALRDAIRSFISDEDVLPSTAKIVEEYAEHLHPCNLWNGLLLLRGLLACNILLFSLAERRWRVDYGLVPLSEYSGRFRTPTTLAVPYRAKDVPAPDTQFGHPDVTIILTCLSYYYTGLSEEQLRVSFEILLDQSDPSTEYALWVKEHGCESLPHSLQELGEINLKPSEQWDKVIFPLFARNHATVDFYLSRVVFPREAKEFPWKLSASSWDLAEERENVITGFSGTSDGRWLLPMSIAQHDLDYQQGTNARVLAYLLRPENSSYMVTHENSVRWTTLRFLQTVATQQPKIRVLLDVGAQILDFSNRRVAEAWLDITCDTIGAIYFNERDELMVLAKNGTNQSMLSSPLSQQLERCVVYLDHAHTRGTDIKLPSGSRAAVTLGPKVTKDHLVQGCMRMRKLGIGHSVMFFAPPEVDRSIRGVVGKKDPNTRVATADILCWAIHETWADIQQRAPYWAQQGMNYKSRSGAWFHFCNGGLGPEGLSDVWLQPESKSLADLYAPSATKKNPSILLDLAPEIRQRCKDLGVLSLPTAQMEEEQEREVNLEREREREVELPPTAESVEHFLHHDVVAFVNTGAIPPLYSGGAFHPVFSTLKRSSAATQEPDVWSPFVLATTDFCKTIKSDTIQGNIDQYLRPVQWILSSKKDHKQVLVLLSPFEADRLMPDIRASKCVHLHVYAPRTSQRVKPFDDLKLYCIPPLPSDWTPPWALIDQLNVFAGQLYLRDYQSYLHLCRFLGVPTKESPNDTAIQWNLFKIPCSFEQNEIRFLDSPLPLIVRLLAIRNRGRPFRQTHMGKILQGQLLTEKDFEEPPPVVSGHNLPASETVSMR